MCVDCFFIIKLNKLRLHEIVMYKLIENGCLCEKTDTELIKSNNKYMIN